jgi:hypothetical protein
MIRVAKFFFAVGPYGAAAVDVGIYEFCQFGNALKRGIDANAYFAKEAEVRAGSGVADDLVDAGECELVFVLQSDDGKVFTGLHYLLDVEGGVYTDAVLVDELFDFNAEGAACFEGVFLLATVYVVDVLFTQHPVDFGVGVLFFELVELEHGIDGRVAAADDEYAFVL